MAEFKINITRAVKDTAERALDECKYKGHTIREWADKITSGEYQPVKHGRWIWVKNFRDCEGDIYSQYKCSCCSFVVGSVYSINDLTRFCGNCGARMDGDSK